METIRIFISSPGDVVEERERARQVIEGLRRRYLGHFHLQPLLWEDLPLQPAMSFQQGIDTVLSGTGGIDIAVFILWSRLGSPVGAVIQKPDGGEYRSGTEREFDLMMRAYELSDGERPHILVYTRQDDDSFEERLNGASMIEKREMLAQKTLIEDFIRDEFYDAETSTNLRAYHIFSRPIGFSDQLVTHLKAILDPRAGDSAEVLWDTEKQGPPFMGLAAFQAEHADVFWGRDREILEARRALTHQAKKGCAFLMLSGASGSGKSSLARAGILPAICRDELDETTVAWRSLITIPSELTPDPVDALLKLFVAHDLLPSLSPDTEGWSKMLTAIRENPQQAYRTHLHPQLIRLKTHREGDTRLILLVDQWEEFYTSGAVEMANRHCFLGLLQALARSGRCRVLATIRSDFYQHIATDPVLVQMKSGSGLIDVLPPEADGLGDIITGPARTAGLQYEEKDGISLAKRIQRDAAAHAELLPLLEFVLRELYERRTPENILTYAAYEELGGVEGALSAHAEAAYLELPGDAQECLSRVLQHIITLGTKRNAAGRELLVRQYASISLFAEGTPERALVNHFIACRLFIGGADNREHGPTVTVAHESLLRVWPRAVKWAENNRDLLHTRARIERRIKEHSPVLGGDPLLESAKQHLATSPDAFSPEQADFIHQSVDTAEARRRRSIRLRRQVIVGLSLLTILAIAGAIYGFRKADEAQKAQGQAETAGAKAEKAKATAEGLISSMLFDLQGKLEPLGRIDLLKDVSQQAENYFRENPPDSIEAERIQASMWLNRGDILRNVGEMAEARSAYQRSLKINEGLSKAHPDQYIYRRNWSISLERLGDVSLSTGETAAALQYYEQSLEIKEFLTKEVPESAQAQHNWAIGLRKCGDVALKRKDIAVARDYYQRGLEISAHLAKADPNNLTLQRYWGSALESMGDVATLENDIDTARRSFQQMLEIFERLVQQDPTSSLARRDWAIALEKLGDVSFAENDLSTARQYFLQEEGILKGIAEDDPNNADAQQAWSISLEKLGNVALAGEKTAEARQYYQQILEIRERLAKADQADVDAQRQWCFSIERLGDLAMAEGEAEVAREFFETEYTILDRLAKADSENQQDHISLSIVLIKFAQASLATNDTDAAFRLFGQTIILANRVIEATPNDATIRRNLVLAYVNQAMIYEEKKMMTDAVDLWKKAYEQALSMKENGMLSEEDEEYIIPLREKAGIQE